MTHHTFDPIDDEYAGDYLRISFPVEDDAGNPESQTGATADWALFDHHPAHGDDPTAVLDESAAGVTLTVDESNDEIVLELGTDATADLDGTHYHRLQVTDADGRQRTWIGKHAFVDVG